MANIKEVAKKANVSVATVSRVINNKGYVNEETRKLVENAIEVLQYIPNEFARSLYKKISKTIGIIVPHLNNPFYYRVIEGIEDIAFDFGYKVMLCNSRENIEREKEYLKQFIKYNIDGLIIGSNSNEIARYLELNIPIVTIDRIISDKIPSVTSDNTEGGRKAAKKIIDSGCKNIVHFRGPSILLTVQQRAEGFNEYLSSLGLVCDEVDLAFIDPDTSIITDYLKSHPTIDGIFCDSDTIASYCMHELTKLGKKIPEDVQIIGYDNTILAQLTIPNLTTISQRMYNIGSEAMDSLETLISKNHLEIQHKVIPVTLIERESTK